MAAMDGIDGVVDAQEALQTESRRWKSRPTWRKPQLRPETGRCPPHSRDPDAGEEVGDIFAQRQGLRRARVEHTRRPVDSLTDIENLLIDTPERRTGAAWRTWPMFGIGPTPNAIEREETVPQHRCQPQREGP